MRAQGQAGFSGEFSFVKHDVRGLRGTGPSGGVTFWDLWQHDVVRGFKVLRRDARGDMMPTHPERVVEERKVKNKITKRGISAFMHRTLSGHPGGPYAPADITFSPTLNPFLAFFIAGDDGVTTLADQRVTWGESDGQFDTRVPVNAGNAGEGLRAILLSDTTGPGLKRASIAYPTTTPYREIEYTLFAQANVPTYPTGQVAVVAGASMVDGEWFELEDGINPKLRFEYDSNASVADWDGDPANPIPIRFTGGDTQTQVRDETVRVVNSILDDVDAPLLTGTLYVTAVAGAGAGDSDLTHDKGGVIGAIAIVTSPTPAFTVTGMTGGGGALETADDGMDNLIAKAVGLANGVQAGNGEAENLVGIRSVIGLAPTLQGLARYVYRHEETPGALHEYIATETLGGVGVDGFVQSGVEEETVAAATTASAKDQITLATKRFSIAGLALTRLSKGRTIRIANSGAGNDADYTVATVVSQTDFVSVESPAADESGPVYDATELLLNRGDLVFDGDISSERLTGLIDLGQKWRSVDSSGPHKVGRIWQAAKDIVACRIVAPAGTPVDNLPDDWTMQYLDVDGPAGGVASALRPDLDTHWTTIDAPITGESPTLLAAKEGGVLYAFSVAPPTGKAYGFRLTLLQAGTPTIAVEVAELQIMTSNPAISLVAGVDDVLRVSLDGGGTWKNFEVGNYTGTFDQTLVDAINAATLLGSPDVRMRGFGVEALLSSNAEWLHLRATDSGDNATLAVDSVANGSTASAKLGLNVAGDSATGKTETFRKDPDQPETIIYRANMSGDLS